jgi:hypothetical protein
MIFITNVMETHEVVQELRGRGGSYIAAWTNDPDDTVSISFFVNIRRAS